MVIVQILNGLLSSAFRDPHTADAVLLYTPFGALVIQGVFICSLASILAFYCVFVVFLVFLLNFGLSLNLELNDLVSWCFVVGSPLWASRPRLCGFATEIVRFCDRDCAVSGR